MGIKIRKATLNDFAELPVIEKEAAQAFIEAGYADIAEMQPLPASFYSDLPSTAIILVAEWDRKIAGFCVVVEIDGEAYLKELSVSYDYSGRGIGKALLQESFHAAQIKGYQVMTLTTFSDLPFNAPLYQRFGFKEFVPDQSWPELEIMCEDEKHNELAKYKRIAMIKLLGGSAERL